MNQSTETLYPPSMQDQFVAQSRLMTFVETRSRRTDCDTSKAAAKAAVTRKADGERQTIIAAVKRSFLGLTARQIAMVTGIDYIEVQRRVSECGLVKTKKRRDGCAVWEAVQ